MFSRLTGSIILALIIHPLLAQTTAGSPPVETIKKVSSSDWKTLNTTVKGRLRLANPWSRPCFDNYNGQSVARNEAECAYVQQNYFNSHLNRSQEFAAYSAVNWETCQASGEECELDWQVPTNPLAYTHPQKCKQGSVPPYFIDVRNKDDVIAAFKFSKRKGVPLTIKNTGHDFQGRSSGQNTLGLWLHNIKHISRRRDFVPEGCSLKSSPPQDAVTIGAGKQFYEVYQYAEDNGITIVGGADESVGAVGGWLQGGGHSSLSPSYGLGVDRVLQFKIVTPDGVYRVVNSCKHSDLFYALRGGGGGTFGVVLEATVMASPATSFRAANINWPVGDNAALEPVIGTFVDTISKLATQGWGGYLTPAIGNLILTTSTLNLREAEASIKPLLDVTRQLGGVSNVTELSTFFSWFNGYVQGTSGVQNAVGLPVTMSSRFFPAKLHETAQDRAKVKDAILKGFNSTFFNQIHIVTPYGFKGKGSDGAGTSVNPLWRSSLYQVIYVNTWGWNETLADRKAAYAASSKAASYIRELTPDGGAYANEADTHEPNWQYSFWNKNYNKLVSIKKKYDPDHLLDCWHCVGFLGERHPRYKCYI